MGFTHAEYTDRPSVSLPRRIVELPEDALQLNIDSSLLHDCVPKYCQGKKRRTRTAAQSRQQSIDFNETSVSCSDTISVTTHIVPVGVTSKRDRHVYSLSIMRRTRFLSIVADLLCRSPNMFCIRHRHIYQQLKNARRIRRAVLFGTIYCVKTILVLNVSWYGSNTFRNNLTPSIDTLLNSQKWSFENCRTSTRRLTADEKKSCR